MGWSILLLYMEHSYYGVVNSVILYGALLLWGGQFCYFIWSTLTMGWSILLLYMEHSYYGVVNSVTLYGALLLWGGQFCYFIWSTLTMGGQFCYFIWSTLTMGWSILLLYMEHSYYGVVNSFTLYGALLLWGGQFVGYPKLEFHCSLPYLLIRIITFCLFSVFLVIV